MYISKQGGYAKKIFTILMHANNLNVGLQSPLCSVSICWNKAPLYWTRKSTETRLYKKKCVHGYRWHAKRVCEQGRDDGKNDVRLTYGDVTTPRPPAIDDIYTLVSEPDPRESGSMQD